MAKAHTLARWLFGGLLLGASLSITLGSAGAAPANKAPASAEPKLDVEAVRKALAGGREAELVRALNQLKAAPKQGAQLAPELGRLLGAGSTAQVTLLALEAAGAIALPSLSASVAPYIRHRSANMRHASAEALTHTGGPIAIAAFRGALRGRDAELRARAALALGELGAKEAVADLFLALEHRVFEAASSIGKLCDAADCDRFIAQTGKLPFGVLSTGAEPLLLRLDTGAKETSKLTLIASLAALETKDATELLLSVYQRLTPAHGAALEKALRESIEANGGEVPKK